jgi:NAD(P)-dependent dehydrogenase (short-subunit alcohol dehydrogenase family)
MNNTGTYLVSQFGLSQETLAGETIVVTGAGGGIGYEAARALLWLGANVIIAEIDQNTGQQAAQALGDEFNPERVLFVQTDVGEQESVQNLAVRSLLRFGKVDVVVNNATIAVLGTVLEVPIERWDDSYHVNMRGPVLMAQVFLPGMIERGHGSFLCVSSTGTAYLGGYETFKAAQVHLANTLDAELEGTGVNVLTIGPGLVMTDTARQAVMELAPRMEMSLDEFMKMNHGAILTVEEAGVGFALAVVFAERFRGQEISSMQALRAADINFGTAAPEVKAISSQEERDRKLALCQAVRKTLEEQSQGWKQRSIFERQWVLRDFKKTAGMPVEEWLELLTRFEKSIQAGIPTTAPPLSRLASYYNRLAELAKGYEKDPVKLEESLRHVYRWKEEVEQLEKLL